MKTVRKVIRSIRGISIPIGGISWEPEGIEDKLVDIKYPSDSGIQKELENVGYKVRWCAEDKLSRRIDMEGWEKVVWEDQTGKQFLLKCRSDRTHLTLIMKKQENA